MEHALVIALLAGLGAMVGWGAADFFAKKAVDTIGPIKSLVWAHLFGAIAFGGVLLVQTVGLGRTVHLPHNAVTWLYLAGFGVLQMLVYWLVYQAFEKGQLAILNPIFASFTGLVAVFSIIFFGEHLSLLLALALIVIFGSVIVLNLDLKDLNTKKVALVPGLKEILAATVLAAIWTIGWDKLVHGQDALPYAAIMYAFMSFAAYCLARLMRVKLSGVSKGIWKLLVLMGLGETLAYLSISWGYGATSHTSIVALVSGAFSVPTVILAYFFLHERLNRLQSAAIVGIVSGIVLVAIS